MKLIARSDQGRGVQFTFHHRTKKLPPTNITVVAINEANARRKAWGQVKLAYQHLRGHANL